MRVRRAAAVVGAATCLAACATAAGRAGAPLDLTPPAGAAAPPHAALYAACLGEATDARRYDLSSDPSTQLLRFTCRGPAAHALFTALGPWSAEARSQWRRDGRVWRSTIRVERDLFGVDYCSTAEGGDDAQCVITPNAGRFLIARPAPGGA